MTFDYSKLRGKIVERFGTVSNFAKTAGANDSYLSRKLKTGNPFNTDTVFKMSEILGITGEIEQYFFCGDCSKK